jgi:cyclopropane-fatty-acyl-phospholipid synthase
MKKEELDERPPLQRILARDGFSPDLPATLAPRAGSLADALALRLLLHMLSGLREGALDVIAPDGRVHRFRGAGGGTPAVLALKRPAALARHVLFGGEVGFGDAYLDECWDAPDLTRLLVVLHRNERHYRGPFEKNVLGRLYGHLRHKLRANTKRQAQRNIRHHYDLGNDFYRLWLDETLTYSSAIFEDQAQSLRDAQLHKYRLMFERLQLSAGHELLEIGSGWGGFAIYCAQQSGCRVHSITLSPSQLEEAQRRAQAAGVAERVRFELRDYRDVAGQYDRVVSIEMYEAVGEEWWPAYFSAIARALKPGGRAALQAITISPTLFPQYRRKRDFIQKYIFPGGMLCPPGHFLDLARKAGLRSDHVRFYGFDYAETLARWHAKVLAERAAIERLYDARFLRMWRYYLSYCETGFRCGDIDLMQVNLQKA